MEQKFGDVQKKRKINKSDSSDFGFGNFFSLTFLLTIETYQIRKRRRSKKQKNKKKRGKGNKRCDALSFLKLFLLVSASGWEAAFNAPGNYSTALWPMAHFQSFIWAPYIFAFAKSGMPLFLDRAYSGIAGTMAEYPNWRWTEYFSEELSHMILPLAWLARVKPTDEVAEML